MGSACARVIEENAKELVASFGTGFILKKNLNSVLTAGVGDWWVEVVRRLEEASPKHFAATFSETYSRLYSTSMFYKHAHDGLVLYLSAKQCSLCCKALPSKLQNTLLLVMRNGGIWRKDETPIQVQSALSRLRDGK